jgi:ribosomal protein L35
MSKSGKTKKALSKRFKITRNKKMTHRKCGQNHFLAKRSGNKTRAKRKTVDFFVLAKTLKKSIKK